MEASQWSRLVKGGWPQETPTDFQAGFGTFIHDCFNDIQLFDHLASLASVAACWLPSRNLGHLQVLCLTARLP